MTTCSTGLISIALGLALSLVCPAADRSSPEANAVTPAPVYVAVNEDLGFPASNAIAFYQASGTQLTFQNSVSTGGHGIQGGFFGSAFVSSVPSITAPCIYVSDAGSNDVASIALPSQQLVGTFSGSQSDNGSSNGIGLAVNSNYLYASFSSSQTIGTFSLREGCGLTFLGDVPVVGLQGGSVTGMAVNANILVVAYGDGSIQSFNVSAGLPVSNNDLQNSTAFTVNGLSGAGTDLPTGVDITRNGHYAIFGDVAPFVTLEVSDISSGKLTKTVVHQYGKPTGVDAGTVRLSPDQSLLYVTNNESGTVMAFFFYPSTGGLIKGCTSAPLQGFNGRPWYGSVVTRDTTGTGNVLYVAEFGRDQSEINHGPSSAIGILTINSKGGSCTLTESSNSPVLLSFPGALTLGAYPPRPF